MSAAATGGQSNQRPFGDAAGVFGMSAAATGGQSNARLLGQGAGIFGMEEQRS